MATAKTSTTKQIKNKKQGTHQKSGFQNQRKEKDMQAQAEQQAHFSKILATALTEPGRVNAAYRAFHNFSLGNQMLAAEQLMGRGLDLSPISPNW